MAKILNVNREQLEIIANALDFTVRNHIDELMIYDFLTEDHLKGLNKTFMEFIMNNMFQNAQIELEEETLGE